MSTAIEAETGAYEVADAEGYDDVLTVIVGDDAYMKDHPEHAETNFTGSSCSDRLDQRQ